MNTKLINAFDKSELDYSLKLLADNEIIAIPTETVYGIACDIYSTVAAGKIYELKKRESKKPLSAHVSSIEMAESVIVPPSELFYKLAERFLPGPLAIIVKKNPAVSDEITSGFDSISIRFPDDAACRKLIEEYGKPLAATSANLSGEASLVSSDEVYSKFSGRIPAIVIGESKLKRESTIISLLDNDYKILREGAIPSQEIMKFINENC